MAWEQRGGQARVRQGMVQETMASTNRTQATWDGGQGEMGSWCFMGIEIQFGMIKKF